MPELATTTASSSSHRRKRTKTSKKDVNKPKRPSSAYAFFVQDQTEAVKEELGRDCHMNDVFATLGERWRNLSQEQKEVNG